MKAPLTSVHRHPASWRWLPAMSWLREYDRSALTGDVFAALIVTLMLVPQSLAYAMLAGLPPQIGLLDRLKRSEFLQHLTGRVFLSQHQAMATLDPESTARADAAPTPVQLLPRDAAC